MTCVWQSLFSGLDRNDRRSVGRCTALPRVLKSNNRKTSRVTVNGDSLTQQQLAENEEAVRSFNVSSINGGYWCSAFDPFICLYAEHFNIRVVHTFHTGARITYSVPDARYEIRLRSSRGHMSFRGTSR